MTTRNDDDANGNFAPPNQSFQDDKALPES